MFEQDSQYIFDSPYEQYRSRNKQVCTVLKAITEPDCTHDLDVLPMYLIRFEDGEEIEAYSEELDKYCRLCDYEAVDIIYRTNDEPIPLCEQCRLAFELGTIEGANAVKEALIE